jgi:hypothetical protein
VPSLILLSHPSTILLNSMACESSLGGNDFRDSRVSLDSRLSSPDSNTITIGHSIEACAKRSESLDDLKAQPAHILLDFILFIL